MNENTWSTNLYLINFVLLSTHEIDAAYWKEWDLFGIPGGIQLFLILNFALLSVGLFGFKQLLRGIRSGYYFALFWAGTGIAAFVIHSYFILMGRPEFRLPVSVALLILILFVSLAQGYLTLKELRAKPVIAKSTSH